MSVERVARAMWAAREGRLERRYRAPFPERDHGNDIWSMARAAIEALREPSETMERAGADVLDGSYVGACAVWGKMIYAALAP